MTYYSKIVNALSTMAVFIVLMASCSSSKTNSTNLDNLGPEEAPVIFRRTTLIVHDIDESLQLYQEAMGMTVIYDNIIQRPHPENPEKQQEIRLVFLKATHDYVGVIGLVDYEYNNPSKVRQPSAKEGFTTQNAVLLFNTNNLEENFMKISKVPGVEVVKKPGIRTYPSYDGKGVIKVLVSIFYDLDGFLIEYNQVISGM